MSLGCGGRSVPGSRVRLLTNRIAFFVCSRRLTAGRGGLLWFPGAVAETIKVHGSHAEAPLPPGGRSPSSLQAPLGPGERQPSGAGAGSRDMAPWEAMV